MTGRSFRCRLATVTTALCFLLLSLSSSTVFLVVRAALLRNLDRTLISIARTEISSVTDGPDSGPHLHQHSPAELRAPSYAVAGVILDASRKALVANPNLEASVDERSFREALSGRPVLTNLKSAGIWYRASYVPVDIDRSRCVEVLAISREPVDHTLNVLGLVLAAALATGTALAGAGSWILAGRLTRPLRSIVEATERVGREQDLSLRIPGTYEDAELEFVQSRINGTLDLLEGLFREKEHWIESRRQMMADMSHELRSPLTNLRSALDVTLRRPREPQDYRQALEECRREVERLSHLAEDLLTLSRSELGQLSLDVEGLDLESVVREAAEVHSGLAAERKVEVRLDTAPIVLQGDRRRLRQVLDNLLTNALGHAPSGSAVWLSLGGCDGFAVLTVADQGPGIPDQDRERVFERFYRGDPSRCRATGGTGLGLPLCRAVVESHGGSIQALPSSSGALLQVRLPIVAQG